MSKTTASALTREDLAFAIQAAKVEPRDAYSHWCAGTSCKTVSARTLRRLQESA